MQALSASSSSDPPFQAIAAKALNKEALQAAAGLPVDRKIPLVAFVGRLEEQKGPDVMAAAIPQLMEEDVQIVLLVRRALHHVHVAMVTIRWELAVCLIRLHAASNGYCLQGTGKKKFECMLMSAEEKYPDKVRAVVKFNAALAHHIMAGADLLAVTSRFEPCGLIQLQGMRYGTVRLLCAAGCNPETMGKAMPRLMISVAIALAALRVRVHRWARRHRHRRQDRIPHGPPQRRRKALYFLFF